MTVSSLERRFERLLALRVSQGANNANNSGGNATYGKQRLSVAPFLLTSSLSKTWRDLGNENNKTTTKKEKL